MLFDKKKYTWLIIGLVVTAIGFLLMIGGGSDDPEQFSDAIFGFRRMTLAPILVLAGYAIQIYAIMKKTTNIPEPGSTRAHAPSKKAASQTTPSQKTASQKGKQSQTTGKPGKTRKK